MCFSCMGFEWLVRISVLGSLFPLPLFLILHEGLNANKCHCLPSHLHSMPISAKLGCASPSAVLADYSVPGPSTDFMLDVSMPHIWQGAKLQCSTLSPVLKVYHMAKLMSLCNLPWGHIHLSFSMCRNWVIYVEPEMDKYHYRSMQGSGQSVTRRTEGRESTNLCTLTQAWTVSQSQCVFLIQIFLGSQKHAPDILNSQNLWPLAVLARFSSNEILNMWSTDV